MYSQDSFFDLTQWGQVGLACLSAALFLLVIIAARVSLHNRPIWMQVAGSFIFFWLFVWLSPQAYYQYYILIIPDLPRQWVIKPLPNPITLVELLFLQGPQNLSAHGKALLGWCLITAPLIRFRRRRD